jgi:hypothetical protein
MSGRSNEANELNALADALRELAPQASRLDQRALLFRAGQASVPRRGLWPLATGLATCAALVLAGVMVSTPGPQRVVERVTVVKVVQPAPVPPPSVPVEDSPGPGSESTPVSDEEPLPSSRYFQVQQHLIRWGFDGLARPAPPVAAPAKPHSLKDLLNSI